MPRLPAQPKPEGWRSQRSPGSLSSEKREAASRPNGRAGRNSGRGWDERGGNDFTLGRRGEDIAVAVDLKETRSNAYLITPQVIKEGQKKAVRQGYEFALQIKFYDRNSGVLLQDVTVIPTSLYDELMKRYEKKAKANKKK